MFELKIALSENGNYAYFKKSINHRCYSRIERTEFKKLFKNAVFIGNDDVKSHCEKFFTNAKIYMVTK